MKSLPTIYKKTSTGKIQQWTIEIHEDKYRTRSSQVGGKETISEFTVCKGKNGSKANGTTAAQQAEKEATAKRRLKLEGEYKETQDECTGDVGFIKPMLAKDYKDYKDVLEFPVYSDKKYNGVRCVCTAAGMYSRNGKPILAAPHIHGALQQLFVSHPNLVLDGELYNHTLRHKLNRIIELVRRTKSTAEDLVKSKDMVQFHIYDGYGFDLGEKFPVITANSKFSIRKQGLELLLSGFEEHWGIVLVQSDYAKNQKELDTFYKQYLADGYEGQMIRIDAPYANKRSDVLLKRKEFIDAEFEVLDVIQGEGNRTGTAGAVICKLPKATYDRNGNLFETFKSNIKGDFEFTTDVWVNRKQYIGKKATVKFFAYTEYNVPQFPYVIAFRNYE